MFLGLDLGTTNVKALVVNRQGSAVAAGSAPVTRSTTPGGGVEQDINQIWEATCQAIRQAVENVPAEKIEAVGVSSQGGALQLLDARGEPLGPVISWLDTRGKPFDRRLEQEWGETYLTAHTGCNLSSMALGQLVRIEEEAHGPFEAAEQVGFVGDTIVGRLCGRRAHDPTSLSIGMLYNPKLGSADPELLARLKIDDKRLPDLVAATTPAGPLQPAAARATGLPEGIPVSPAIHDQYAASLGAGTVEEGDVLVGTGTAWVLLATTGRLAPPIARRTFVCPHPVGGLFGQLLSMTNGGSAVEWVLAITGQDGLRQKAFDERLASVPPGADGLSCWPLFVAGGAPVKAPTSPSGSLSGITLAHSANHLLRAVIEGLACELARHLGWFTQAQLPVERLMITGPVAASPVVSQILADVTDRPVLAVCQPDVSAFGAAAVARAIAEPNVTLRASVEAFVPDCHTIRPGQNAPVYRARLEAYLGSFPPNTPTTPKEPG